jgi:hypothetical protein
MRVSRRTFNLVASAAAVDFLLPGQSNAVTDRAADNSTVWSEVKLGGGGYTIGIDIALDGAKAVKIDVYGGYQWDNNSLKWIPLFNSTNFANYIADGPRGVWEIAFAPNNSSRLYMSAAGYLYRRDNGLHDPWVKTALPRLDGYYGGGNTDPNGPFKFANQKMCVDPNNGDIVYVATNNNGIQVSFNAGHTFSRVSTIPASNIGPGGAGLCFDRGSGVVRVGGQTRTRRVIIPSFGHGIWESADGGVVWTQIADGANSPQSVWTAQMDAAGAYWCNEQNRDLFLYRNAVWKKVLANYFQGSLSNAVCVDPNPAMAGRCIVSGPSGGKSGRVTLDYGETFIGKDTWFAKYPGGGQGNLATDVPYLALCDNSFMSVGDMKFDPSIPVYRITGITTKGSTTISSLSSTKGLHVGQYVQGNGIPARATISKIIPQTSSIVISSAATANGSGVALTINADNIFFAEGVGVWKGNWPIRFQPFDWYSQSAGIESLVASRSIAPTGARPIFAVEDRNVFSNNDLSAYPSTYYPPSIIASAWSVDYASSDPKFLASQSNYNGKVGSSYSADSGVSWQLFPTTPTATNGGAIACATPKNIVIIPGNNGLPIYTADGGSRWSTCAGLPATGWIYSLWNNCQIVCADRVSIGTFYAYNYDRTDQRYGIYRSTDGGANWRHIFIGWPSGGSSSAQNELLSVPQRAGHIWFNPGATYVPGARLYNSTDGGVTWKTVISCDSVYHFGFGAPRLAGNYPTIFIYGKVHGALGIWRSEDAGFTWAQVSDAHPNGSLDSVQCVNGDLNYFGRVYVGFGGNGFAYGKLRNEK